MKALASTDWMKQDNVRGAQNLSIQSLIHTCAQIHLLDTAPSYQPTLSLPALALGLPTFLSGGIIPLLEPV